MEKSKKRKKRNILIGILSVIVMALIAVGAAIHASEVTTIKGLDGSDATVTNSQGQQVDPSQIPNDSWISYNIDYNWSIPDSTNISAGDTATVTLPAGMVVNKDLTGNLVDSKGQVVGTVKFTKGSSTGTITFNNVLHDQYGKHGTLSITAVKDSKSSSSTTGGTAGSNLPQWGINKAGWIDSGSEKDGAPTKLYWDIVINPQGKKLKDVKVTDTIGQGQSYDNGSATFHTVSYASGSEQRTGTTTGKVTVSGNQVTFDLGDIDSAVEIEYETNITDIDKNGGNIWYNQAKVTTTSNVTDWSRTKDSATVNWGAGGTAQSYEGKIEITKVDSTDTTKVLPGATFELKNEVGQVVKTGLTTGADGKITVDDLPDGKYQLIETKAPNGYQLDSTPITVIISQSNNHTATTVVKDTPIASSSSSSSVKSSSKSSSVKSSSSLIKSSSKKSSSSSVKSSTKSSSVKSSSSSIKSSSKSSVVKSSSKVSSKRSSSNKASSSVKSSAKSSSVKSSSITGHHHSRSGHHSVKSNVSSSKSVLSSEISSNDKKSSSSVKGSSVESSVNSSSASKDLVKSSSIDKSSSSNKSMIDRSHRTGSRSVKSNSSVGSSSLSSKSSSSSAVKASSSSALTSTPSKSNVKSESSKPTTDTETSVKVTSKTSTTSYVDHTTESSVPVTGSSNKNTMVESSISTPVRNGSSSVSYENKPTLVSSSMNVPVTSWTNTTVHESSAVTTGTTVTTYSQSKISNKANTETTPEQSSSHVANVVNNQNSSHPTQGGVTGVANNGNHQPVQSSQANKGKGQTQGDKSGNGEGLPQTGEDSSVLVLVSGIVLVIVGGTIILKKNN